MTDHTIRSVASITREGRAPQPHACDAPNLSAKEFLLAVMHDRTLPLATRIKAASALLPFTNSVPRPTNSVPRCKIVIGGLGPYDQSLSPEDPEQINTISQSKSAIANNNPHPQSGAPGPLYIEENPEPSTSINYSTPPTPAELQEIKAAINRLRPDLAHLPVPEPHLCACGHWIFGPCPLGERCCDRTKLN